MTIMSGEFAPPSELEPLVSEPRLPGGLFYTPRGLATLALTRGRGTK